MKFTDQTIPSRIEMLHLETLHPMQAKDISGSAIELAKETLEKIYVADGSFDSFHHNNFVQHAIGLFEAESIYIQEKEHE